jgi:hypothetical protein
MFIPQAVPRHVFSQIVTFSSNTKVATHVGANNGTTLPSLEVIKDEVPRQVIAMDLFHLFLIIQLLARADIGCYYPDMTLFRDALYSLTHIGLILDSKFVFRYAAKYLVTSKNALEFARTVLRAFEGELNYEWTASLIGEAFGNIIRMNPAIFNFIATFHSTPPQFRALARRVCKSVGNNNARFWKNQPRFIRCTECHKAISRADSVLSIAANVQVMPCCYSLIHYDCFQRFLLRSVACDHDCCNVLSCVKLSPQLDMRNFNFTICQSCAASYDKGWCLCDNELNALVVAKRERLRQANQYNGFDYKSRPEIHFYAAVLKALNKVP